VRHLLTLFEISQQELHSILSISQQVKHLLVSGRRPPWLARRVLALLFEKPSLRTRVSFEAGIQQLGGSAMFLGQDVGWQSREATGDFIRVLAEYADLVVCRAKRHASVDDLASYDCVPIINGLTDLAHPCQALADVMTMQEIAGPLAGRMMTFVGDGNNVARSLALAAAMVGMRFRLLGPDTHRMDDKWLGGRAAGAAEGVFAVSGERGLDGPLPERPVHALPAGPPRRGGDRRGDRRRSQRGGHAGGQPDARAEGPDRVAPGPRLTRLLVPTP